jgi:chromosome segregation ATPase
VGSEPDGQSLVDRGRRWLAERESATHRLGSLDAERARLTARVDALLPQLEMATSEVERTDSAARNARRRVEVLEAEMVNRMQPVSDPATRAATAAALRDHVSALEARITAAKSEAEGKQSVASKGLSAATVRFDQARRDTDDLSRRATLAARLLPERAELPDDLLSDLGTLAAALRHEYQALDDTLGSLADGVAAAAEREAELSAALSDLRALDADEREPLDQADAVRRLLHAVERTSDVVLDPAVGFGPVAWQPIIDALLEVAGQRPIVVVDSVGDLAAWAERHESGLVEQVSSSEASSSSTTGR